MRPQSRTPEGLRALVRARTPLLPTPSVPLAIAADRVARGANFQLTEEWAVQSYGAAVWLRTLAGLPLVDRREWEGAPVPIGVYRFGALRRMVQALAREADHPEDELVAPLYAFIAGRQLSPVQRLVLRVTTPSFVVSKIPSLWRQLFTVGSARLEKAGVDSAQIRFTVPGCVVDWLAPFTLGTTTRIIELAGGGGATVWEAERRALGADTWDVAYSLDWRSDLDA